MSEFKFSCPSCGQQLICEDVNVGCWVNCPACRTYVVVPKSEDSSPALATEPRRLPKRWHLLMLLAPALLVSIGLAAPPEYSLAPLTLIMGFFLSLPAGLICGFGESARRYPRGSAKQISDGLASGVLYSAFCFVSCFAGCLKL